MPVPACEALWPPPLSAPLLVAMLTGFAHQRLPVMVRNLQWLPSASRAACLVLSHSQPERGDEQLLGPLQARCSVCVSEGTSLVGVLKMAASVVYRHAAGAFFLNDDIELSFDLALLIAKAQAFQLDSASPAIGGTWKSMGAHELAAGEEGRLVRFLEMGAQWFSVEMWGCFAELLEPEINGGGYGTDVWLFDWCSTRLERSVRMGIFDTLLARQLPLPRHLEAHKDKRSNHTRFEQMMVQSNTWKRRGHFLTISQHSNEDPPPLGLLRRGQELRWEKTWLWRSDSRSARASV